MKYYVVSGELKGIVTASSPKEAAVIAVMRLSNGEEVGAMFYVDERGFRSGHLKPETIVPYTVVCEAYDDYFNTDRDFD